MILVNGRPWPYLNVKKRKYRFRVLNGSNARVYQLFGRAFLDALQAVEGGSAAVRVSARMASLVEL